jgi:hypothetical protein
MPPDYGVPAALEGTLPWAWAETKLRDARLYWLATLHPAGRPHLMPNWGAWVQSAFMFSTSPLTRKARNLDRLPLLSVGVQDGQHAVVIEGEVTLTRDAALLAEMDDAYAAKYGMREGASAAFRVQPHKVFALGDFPHTPTRWVFPRA